MPPILVALAAVRPLRRRGPARGAPGTADPRTTSPKAVAGSYDATGRRAIKVESSATITYAYGPANELLTEDADGTLTAYAYVDNDNILTINAAPGWPVAGVPLPTTGRLSRRGRHFR